jgi:hypothetical protein
LFFKYLLTNCILQNKKLKLRERKPKVTSGGNYLGIAGEFPGMKME